MAIYKRGKDKDSIYYFRKRVKGRDILKSLRTSDKRVAQQRAAEEEEKLRKEVEELKASNASPKLSRVVVIYKTAVGPKASKQTRQLNVRALLSILRHASSKEPSLVSDDECLDLECSVLTRKLVNKWRTFELAKGRDENSLNSSLAQAKSLFSKPAMEIYEDEGLEMPESLDAFREVAKLEAKRVKAFTPLTLEVQKAVEEKIKDLRVGTESEQEMARVIVLAFRLGMRAIEIFRAKVKNLRTDPADGRRGLFIPQTKYGDERLIYFDAEMEQMFPPRPLDDEEDFLIAPKQLPTWRQRIIYRDTNRQLEKILRKDTDYSRSKLLHTLRKQCGAIIASNKGLFEAQKFLGHRNPMVTASYYSGLTRKLQAVELSASQVPAEG